MLHQVWTLAVATTTYGNHWHEYHENEWLNEHDLIEFIGVYVGRNDLAKKSINVEKYLLKWKKVIYGQKASNDRRHDIRKTVSSKGLWDSSRDQDKEHYILELY